jgi:hypothetical protein
VVGGFSIQETSPKSNFPNVLSILKRFNLKEKSLNIVKDLEKHLKSKSKNFLTPNEIHTILVNMINRKRFNYTIGDILQFILRCLCFRKIK